MQRCAHPRITDGRDSFRFIWIKKINCDSIFRIHFFRFKWIAVQTHDSFWSEKNKSRFRITIQVNRSLESRSNFSDSFLRFKWIAVQSHLNPKNKSRFRTTIQVNRSFESRFNFSTRVNRDVESRYKFSIQFRKKKNRPIVWLIQAYL